VRQFETPPSAAWVGNPQGGVSAPDPILLPDPTTRFKRTAARLADLANDHPMSDWLLFLCNLSQAQHEAAQAIQPPVPDADIAAKTSAAGMPPLAADGHRRDAAWREALRRLLERFDGAEDAPEALAAVVTDLESYSEAGLEALADAFLGGSLPPERAGHSLFVAAALQVYFTRLAARLPADRLGLLPERNLCPCCGSTSVSALVTASGKTPGVRYLYCSLCSTAWNHVRAVCITCGQSGKLAVRAIEGEEEASIKAETCDDCHTYSKSLYLAKDTELDPYADDLASLGLDLLVSEAGWARHAPNPFLLA